MKINESSIIGACLKRRKTNNNLENKKGKSNEDPERKKENNRPSRSCSLTLVFPDSSVNHRAEDLTGTQFLHLLPSPFRTGKMERRARGVRALANTVGPPNRIPPFLPLSRSRRDSINYLYTIYYIINCNRVLVRPFRFF